jgi:hypothetical protein
MHGGQRTGNITRQSEGGLTRHYRGVRRCEGPVVIALLLRAVGERFSRRISAFEWGGRGGTQGLC